VAVAASYFPAKNCVFAGNMADGARQSKSRRVVGGML
jgi:hypothetical protein